MKPITQSKLESFIERSADTLIAFIISFIIWSFIITPIWGIGTSYLDNLGIISIFTIISLIRGYLIRRFFNKRLHNKVHKLLNG